MKDLPDLKAFDDTQCKTYAGCRAEVGRGVRAAAAAFGLPNTFSFAGTIAQREGNNSILFEIEHENARTRF